MPNIIIGLSLITLDQSSKFFASRFIPVQTNLGVAFGVGEGLSLWLIVLTLLILGFHSLRHGITKADILMISGGLSNIIDRIVRGKIIDWVYVSGLWFNLADIYITIGVVWIFLSYMKTRLL